MRALLLLGLGLAMPARADVGLTGGLVRQAPEGRAAPTMEGWEAGILAMESSGKGFWHFAGGQTRAAGEQLTWGQARLNFTVVNGKTGSLFLGGGTGMGWLDAAGTRRRLWIHSAESGVMVMPLRVLEFIWPSCPCISCLFGRASQDCASCQQRKASTKMMTAIRVGAEVGWRKAAEGLTGPEYRLWTALAF